LSLPDLLIEPIVRAALAEDLGRAGDLTAAACVDADARLSAVFAARKDGRVAGLACARLAIHALDPAARFTPELADGDDAPAGAVLARVDANARALLSAERTALNLLGRLCGIATLTRSYVRAVEGTGVRIADTRKTTPGLRALEKHAVKCGGGMNHRFGLDDAILIKDNHVAALRRLGRRGLRRARAHVGHLVRVEVEVDTPRSAWTKPFRTPRRDHARQLQPRRPPRSRRRGQRPRRPGGKRRRRPLDSPRHRRNRRRLSSASAP
jgi:nicotinate-nucleotide pyrophosphorylase (carboxylating)